jgi:hypothetical protein
MNRAIIFYRSDFSKEGLFSIAEFIRTENDNRIKEELRFTDLFENRFYRQTKGEFFNQLLDKFKILENRVDNEIVVILSDYDTQKDEI